MFHHVPDLSRYRRQDLRSLSGRRIGEVSKMAENTRVRNAMFVYSEGEREGPEQGACD